jgi:hypothetical protein
MKLFMLQGGAKNLMSRDGVEVVEFTLAQQEAARQLAQMPEEDLKVLVDWAKKQPQHQSKPRVKRVKDVQPEGIVLLEPQAPAA